MAGMMLKSEQYPSPKPGEPIINFVGYWQLTWFDMPTKMVFRKVLQDEYGNFIILKVDTKLAQRVAEDYLNYNCPDWKG